MRYELKKSKVLHGEEPLLDDTAIESFIIIADDGRNLIKELQESMNLASMVHMDSGLITTLIHNINRPCRQIVMKN